MLISPSVEQQSTLNFDETSFVVGLMSKPHLGGVSLDVADERLGAVVDHFHRSTGLLCQQAKMDVE